MDPEVSVDFIPNFPLEFEHKFRESPSWRSLEHFFVNTKSILLLN